MTEQNTENEQQDAEQAVVDMPVDKSNKAATGFSLATVLAVFALIVAGGAGFFAFSQWQSQQSASQQQSLQITKLSTRLESLQASVSQQLLQLQNQLDKEQAARASLSANLEKLHKELGRDRQAWTLAEVRYYLRLGNTRLQLLSDTSSAMRALELADARLQVLGNPALHKLRGQIKKELAALRAVPQADIEGASLQLVALSAQVEDLQVTAPTRSKPAKEPLQAPVNKQDWRAHVDNLWAELKILISVRRTDRPVAALLEPEQIVFLRHNLRLKLEAARLALLQRNAVMYKANLAEANRWLKAYFRTDAAPVTALRTQISELGKIDVQPALPDISTSLAMLQRLEASASKPPPTVKKAPAKKASATKTNRPPTTSTETKK